MDYKKLYDSIISKAKSLNRKKGQGIYYESHHIIPRCLGGSDEKENKVLLTAREHYVCHKLLYYIYPNDNRLSMAYHYMINTKKDKRNLKITSREYEEVRLAQSISMKRENRSEETLRKMRDSKIGTKHSEETIKKRSNSMMGENNPMFGRSISIESIEKGKETRRNKSQYEKDERIRKIKESKIGKKMKPESIQKRLETIKNKPESEKKLSIIKFSESLKRIGRGRILKMMETNKNKTQEEKDLISKKKSETYKKNKESNPNWIHPNKGRRLSDEHIAKREASRMNRTPQQKYESKQKELESRRRNKQLIEQERRMMIF